MMGETVGRRARSIVTIAVIAGLGLLLELVDFGVYLLGQEVEP